MSLWVGNISKNVRMAELEDAFDHFGTCEIRQNVSTLSHLLNLNYRNPTLSLNTKTRKVPRKLLKISKAKKWEDSKLPSSGRRRAKTMTSDLPVRDRMLKSPAERRNATTAIELATMHVNADQDAKTRDLDQDPLAEETTETDLTQETEAVVTTETIGTVDLLTDTEEEAL